MAYRVVQLAHYSRQYAVQNDDNWGTQKFQFELDLVDQKSFDKVCITCEY